MRQLQTPFRYDYVGSFLRPAKLKKARRQFDKGNISYDELKKVEDEAITELITKIKESGYHVITDGEFRRATWHLDFMWGFDENIWLSQSKYVIHKEVAISQVFQDNMTYDDLF